MTESIEFVNDWSELEEAVRYLKEEDLMYYDGTGPTLTAEEKINVVAEYVPRLLTQYANLVELSFALTEGWETYATLNAPSGLYLPDNS